MSCDRLPRIRVKLEGFECLTAAGWLIPKAKGAPQEDQRTLPRMPNTPARGLGIVAACGCSHAVGRSAGERLSGTVGYRQAVVFGVKVCLGYGHINITPPNPRRRAPHSCAVVMIHMEDFIERTLR